MTTRIRYIGTLIALAVLCACDGGPWPSADQDRFRDECAAEGGSRTYCNCYLDNVMERYPNASDAEKMDFETAVELAKDCKQ